MRYLARYGAGGRCLRVLGMAAGLVGLGAGWVCAQEPPPGEHGEGMPVPAPTLRINAFADIRYAATDTVGAQRAFGLGQFDLFVRSTLSDRMSVLGEIVVHPAPGNQFRVVLERLLLTYAPRDYLKASFGRFHTAIGYYNAAYHHGTWFQTAAGRPLIVAFESDGGVLPIHTLGVSATGQIPSGRLDLRYIAELGNGRASQASLARAPQPTIRDNDQFAVNVGVVARPEWIPGLQVGVSLYRDRVTPDTLPAFTEWIAAAHLAWQNPATELLAEAIVLRHDLPGGSANVIGYYAQASRAVGPARPYVRYDYVDAPAADPLFAYLGRRQGPMVGLRLDLDEFVALKAQYGRLERSAAPDVGRFEAQLAFTF